MKKELKNIVGKEYVFDDEDTLERYAKDQSFTRRCRPDYVALPQSVEEVQELVKFANKHVIPVIPYSSGLNLRGGTIPDQGGILLNLSRMNKIVEINERNRWVVVEPGVTYATLQNELEKHDLRVMTPLGMPPGRSVLSSYIDRDPVLAATDFVYGNDLAMDEEIVLPNGNLFRVGLWSGKGAPPGSPYGTAIKMYRFFQGTQGTFGIFTKQAIKVEAIPKCRKVFFITFDKIEDAARVVRKIQDQELGLECFLLNAFNLACLINEDWQVPETFPCDPISSSNFEAVKVDLPSWTMIICLMGLERHPEEKVAYEEEDLREVCEQQNVELQTTVIGLLDLEKLFLKELLRPWGILKKFCYKGSVHDISFYASGTKLAEYERTVKELANKHRYPPDAVGAYLLPVERARTYCCQFDFSCDLSNSKDRGKVEKLWRDASDTLISMGAFIDQPYGEWADMVYSRTNTHTTYLRRIKKALDPNNIMNPGKLCF